MPPKTSKICGWVTPQESVLALKNLVTKGLLLSKNVTSWRAPREECPPQPEQGEIIYFTNHVKRGFRPPDSELFGHLLHFFNVRPQNIGPKSMTTICHFQVFYEVFLRFSHPWLSLESSFILIVRLKLRKAPMCNLVAFPYKIGRIVLFLRPTWWVIWKDGTRLGSTVKHRSCGLEPTVGL